jgi:hypothetical protein
MIPEVENSDELRLIHTTRGGQGLAVFLKSLLESEGIHCVIKTDSSTVGFSSVPPMAGLPLANAGPGLFDVYVLDRDADRARDVLTNVESEDQELTFSAQALDGESIEASFGRLVPGLLLGIGVCALIATINDLWRSSDGLAWVFAPMAVLSLAIGIKMVRR